MIEIINDRTGYTVKFIPKAYGGEATVLGMGFAMNIPIDTPIKISAARFFLKHDKSFDTYYLHWDWLPSLRVDKKQPNDGMGHCNVTEADYLELKKHFTEYE